MLQFFKDTVSTAKAFSNIGYFSSFIVPYWKYEKYFVTRWCFLLKFQNNRLAK